jgi:soluble lytic murein transglycosylase-like protein
MLCKLWNRLWHFIIPFLTLFILFSVINEELIHGSYKNQTLYKVGILYPVNIATKIDMTNEITWEDEVVSFSSMLNKAYGISEDQALKYSEWILLTSLYTGAPEILLAGVIMTESTFRDNAISSVGAIGPGQIIPSIWKDFCSGNLNEPFGNVYCSGEILMHYYDYCENNWSCALKNYNVGPGNLRKNIDYYIKAGDRYTKKINNYLSMLRGFTRKSDFILYDDLDIFEDN